METKKIEHNVFKSKVTYCNLTINGSKVLGEINQNPRTVLSSMKCEFAVWANQGWHNIRGSKLHILPVSNDHDLNITVVTHNQRQYYINGKPKQIKEKFNLSSKDEKIQIFNFGAGGHRVVPMHEIEIHE